MKIRFNLLIILLSVGLSAGSVFSYDGAHFGTYTPDQFRDYWYNHGAEISRFTLQQMRYGEIHAGDAVLVYGCLLAASRQSGPGAFEETGVECQRIGKQLSCR